MPDRPEPVNSDVEIERQPSVLPPARPERSDVSRGVEGSPTTARPERSDVSRGVEGSPISPSTTRFQRYARAERELRAFGATLGQNGELRAFGVTPVPSLAEGLGQNGYYGSGQLVPGDHSPSSASHKHWLQRNSQLPSLNVQLAGPSMQYRGQAISGWLCELSGASFRLDIPPQPAATANVKHTQLTTILRSALIKIPSSPAPRFVLIGARNATNN